MLKSIVPFLVGISQLGLGHQIPLGNDAQAVLASSATVPSTAHVGDYAVDEMVIAAVKAHPDPVDALVSLRPEMAAELAQPRLLHLSGEAKPQWMTEGDKLRLRRARQKFMDITDHQDFYSQHAEASWAGKASKTHRTTSP